MWSGVCVNAYVTKAIKFTLTICLTCITYWCSFRQVTSMLSACAERTDFWERTVLWSLWTSWKRQGEEQLLSPPLMQTSLARTRPYAVKVYNIHMGGVDLMDQLVASYRHTLKNKRWYMCIFWHFVNICIANAWCLHRRLGHRKLDLLEFKSAVARALIQSAQPRRPRRPSSTPPPPRKKSRVVHHVADELRCDVSAGHWPTKPIKKNASRCHVTCSSKTRYMCVKCNVPVCPECMDDFHNQ